MYVALRPLVPASRRWLDMGPSTLSFESTSCWPSGIAVSILRPMLGKMRPPHDISNALPGGPTACEARLENGTEMCVGCGVVEPSAFTKMTALGSRSPNGFTPLKLLLARPSQKLRKLNAALITVRSEEHTSELQSPC